MSRIRTHPAQWPRPARAALLLLAALVTAASGALLTLRPQQARRDATAARLDQARAELASAWRQHARLAGLQRQDNTLAAALLLRQADLWTDTDAARLQAKLHRRAEECGLLILAFRPGASATTADGAALTLQGGYAELHRFVMLVSQAPYPVRFDSLDIAPVADAVPAVVATDDDTPLRLQADIRPVTRHLSTPGDTP